MSAPRLELHRPRETSALFADAFRVYRRHLAAFLGIAAAIVVPVDLIVSGVGLKELTSSYDRSPPVGQAVLSTLVSFLVTGPLITATCVYALRRLAAGEPPRAGRSLTDGLEAFTPIFLAVLLAAAGIAAGLLLIVPGIYLAIRWYFVPQAVVVDGRRGPAALTGSGDVVKGRWWRTFGVVLLANLAAALPALALLAPFTALAKSADREVWRLAGEALATTLTAPFVALVSTLLWFDLRSRRGAG
ncbi:MAG: hypothetical protein ABR581_05720 [Thermoleophilaceae bacterium]